MKFIKGIIRKFSNFLWFVSIFLVLCFWIAFVNNSSIPEDNKISFPSFSYADLLVDYLDVGKADCSVIHNKNNVIIIDGGLKNSRLSVVNYIRKNLNSNLDIDLMVLTHPHSDHYGQLVDVLDCFNVKRFITCKTNIDLDEHPGYDNLLKKLKSKKINVEVLKPGTKFRIGDIHIEILGPIKEDFKNVNNNSVVLKLIFKGKKFLFMGDAEKSEELDLLNSGQDLSANIIKLGHHGSNTSSTKNFLSAVNPQYAVVSAGKHYNMGSVYPSEKVRQRLNLLGIKYFVTEDLGTIRFAVSKDGELKVPDAEQNLKKVA